MAAPPELSLKDLSGVFIMNKALSDEPDPVLKLQSVGWARRKAVGIATIRLNVKQYLDENKVTHIDIVQTLTGGIEGSTELRTLNWEEQQHYDSTFGNVLVRNRWINFADVEDLDSYLKEGWEEETGDAPGPDGKRYIYSSAISNEKGWTGLQVWGFAIVEGVRYYVRRIIVKKDDTEFKVRFIYDWQE